MRLHIVDTDGIIDLEFGRWLVNIVRVKLLSSINTSKLDKWDDYISETITLKRLHDTKYFAKDVLIQGAQNLECVGIPGELNIQINPKIFANGFQRETVETLCKMINYGTLSEKGTNIITRVFEDISNDIQLYVRMFYKI